MTINKNQRYRKVKKNQGFKNMKNNISTSQLKTKINLKLLQVGKIVTIKKKQKGKKYRQRNL